MVNCWLGCPVPRPGPWLAAVSYLQCDWWRLDRERRPRWPRMELHRGLTLNNTVTGPGMGKLIQDLLCSKVQSPQNWLLSLMTFSLRSKIGLLLTTRWILINTKSSVKKHSLFMQLHEKFTLTWHSYSTPIPRSFFDIWPMTWSMTVVYYKVNYLPVGVTIWFWPNCRIQVFGDTAKFSSEIG